MSTVVEMSAITATTMVNDDGIRKEKMEERDYWEKISKKLMASFMEAFGRECGMTEFNRMFKGDPRLKKMMAIYVRQIAFVNMLDAQLTLAMSELERINAELNNIGA